MISSNQPLQVERVRKVHVLACCFIELAIGLASVSPVRNVSKDNMIVLIAYSYDKSSKLSSNSHVYYFLNAPDGLKRTGISVKSLALEALSNIFCSYLIIHCTSHLRRKETSNL